MIIHVSTFVWNDGIDPAQSLGLAQALRAHAHGSPVLRSYTCGDDIGMRPGSADFAIVAVCDNEDDLMSYLEDSGHKAAITKWAHGLVSSKQSVQFFSETFPF